MRYYVNCRTHPDERHFIALPKPDPRREDFFDVFTLEGCESPYRREEVRALPVPEIPSALMFLAVPFVALWWSVSGRLRREQAEARRFNGEEEGAK